MLFSFTNNIVGISTVRSTFPIVGCRVIKKVPINT